MDVLYHGLRLDPARNDIRLLGISNNGLVNGQLRCSRVKRSLDDKPECHAQSYVWGKDDPSEPIYVNGHRVLITKNLLRVLTTIQRAADEYPVDATHLHWVDAICLNQADDEEKEVQVPRMDVIFKGAVGVVATLGPAADDSDLFMNAIDRIGQKFCLLSLVSTPGQTMAGLQFEDCVHDDEKLATVEQIMQKRVENEERPKWVILHNLARICLEPSRARTLAADVAWTRASDPDHQLFNASVAFLKREFWHRIWIYQELFLGKNVFLVCGDSVTKLERLLAVFTVLVETTWLWDHDSTSYRELAGNASLALILGDATTITTLTGSKLSPTDLFSLFLQLLGRLGAKWQQDHVYGLLGAASNGRQLGIAADYTMSLHEIIMKLAAVDERWLEFQHLSHVNRR